MKELSKQDKDAIRDALIEYCSCLLYTSDAADEL